MSSRVHEAVKAIALCHNVTPVYESNGVTDQAEAEKQFEDSCRVYQASSPDEVTSGRAQPYCHSCMSARVGHSCVALTAHGLDLAFFIPSVLPTKLGI